VDERAETDAPPRGPEARAETSLRVASSSSDVGDDEDARAGVWEGARRWARGAAVAMTGLVARRDTVDAIRIVQSTKKPSMRPRCGSRVSG
jgi:hypothetical protein